MGEVDGHDQRNPPDISSRGLRAEALSVEFLGADGWVRVVDEVDVCVGPAEVVGLVGESGSGKSVTALAIMGLIAANGRVAGGRVLLDGLDLRKLSGRELADVRGKEFAMIFQEPMRSLNPAFKVGDQIAEVVRRHEGVSRRVAKQRAISLLGRVGIPSPSDRARAYPYEFSGGMRQRVMIAMAVACQPRILIADEPTTALDVTTQAQLLDLLRGMQAEMEMGVLFITHNLGVVADFCDAVSVMYAGQIVENADVLRIFDRPLHPYTAGLLSSVPQSTQPLGGRSLAEGRAPNPGDWPVGCHFAERCEFVRAECSADAVPLERTEAGGSVRCVRAPEFQMLGFPHSG